MTSGLHVILVELTESTYGRQDSGKTPNPSPSLYGNGPMTTKSPEAPSSETRPWATPNGTSGNRTIVVDTSHASVCGKNTVTAGMTRRATANTALCARTVQFPSDRPTETMT